MTAVREECVVEEFTKFENENGPSFAWGRLYSPYDGCAHLNVPAFIKDGYAYLATDLKSFTGGHRGTNYAQYVVEPPAALKKNKFLRPGCIPADDLHTVLHSVEFHPIAELQENTPYQLYKAILGMADALDIDLGGQFKCKICGSAFSAGEELYYLESEFRGNGGIGIETDAPLCEECYFERKCCYCGAECEPDQQGLGEEAEHCIYCLKAECPECGEDIDLSWGKEEDLKAYRELQCCGECYEVVKERKETEEREARIAAKSGDLFEWAEKNKGTN